MIKQNDEITGQGCYGDMNSWVCPECESVNENDTCIICGYPKVIRMSGGHNPKLNGKQWVKITCKKCGFSENEGDFCIKCGNRLSHQNALSQTCRHCGYSNNSPDSRFCGKCGKKLNQKSKWPVVTCIAALVAIVLVAAVIYLKNFRQEPPQPILEQQTAVQNQQPNTEIQIAPPASVPETTIPSKSAEEKNPPAQNPDKPEESKAPETVITGKYAIAVDGGERHSAILFNDGTVMCIGDDSLAQRSTSGWKDIVKISTYSNHTLGLKKDGTVVSAGSDRQGQGDVASWRNIVDIAAGSAHSVGLRSDGTVVAVGANGSGQCDVSEWRNIKAVEANGSSTFGLTEDGTVLVAGSFQHGGLKKWSGIESISASSDHVIGVHVDGTVSSAGANGKGQCDNLGKWLDTEMVAVGSGFTAGLRSTGKVWVHGCDEHNEHAAMQWTDIVYIGSGSTHILGIKADGTLIAKGTNDDGQCNVKAINTNVIKK